MRFNSGMVKLRNSPFHGGRAKRRMPKVGIKELEYNPRISYLPRVGRKGGKKIAPTVTHLVGIVSRLAEKKKFPGGSGDPEERFLRQLLQRD